MDEQILTEELIETTYLYCYKRLQNAQDAEDLAQDILCEALRMIRSGREITSFYSWYWKMAKNRFYMHLRMKQVGAVSLDAMGEQLSSRDTVEQGLLAQDEISELNFAISRLSAIHRQTIILHYLKGMGVADIAAFLRVPEGTIKRRLFDARKEIKEGVKTMTSYGTSAYAPAELTLWGGYSIPEYWGELEDLMTKQICVTCAKEGRTAREIADEIGVAPVYFEKKLKWLVEHKFVKQTTGGRYLTDFCIYPEALYATFWREIDDVYAAIGKELTEAIVSCEEDIRKLDFWGNDFSLGRLMWILYVYAATVLSECMLEIYNGKWIGKVPKDNGKTYRLAGWVRYPDDVPLKEAEKTISVGWSNLHNHFRTSGYRWVTHANLYQAEPFENRDRILTDANMDLFMRIFDDSTLSLTANEEETVANLIRVGYLERNGDGLYPTMPIMTDACKGQIHERLRTAIAPLAMRYVQAVGEIGERILLPATRRDLTEEFVHWIMQGAFFPVKYALYYGWNAPDSVTEKPDDVSRSSLGIVIYYNR